MEWLLHAIRRPDLTGRIYLHKDVVDGNVDQLDDKANNTHDEESHGDGLGDLKELWI